MNLKRLSPEPVFVTLCSCSPFPRAVHRRGVIWLVFQFSPVSHQDESINQSINQSTLLKYHWRNLALLLSEDTRIFSLKGHADIEAVHTLTGSGMEVYWNFHENSNSNSLLCNFCVHIYTFCIFVSTVYSNATWSVTLLCKMAI